LSAIVESLIAYIIKIIIDASAKKYNIRADKSREHIIIRRMRCANIHAGSCQLLRLLEDDIIWLVLDRRRVVGPGKQDFEMRGGRGLEFDYLPLLLRLAE
jgi:hypothetical protein